MKISNFFTICVDLVFGRLSMIFTFAAICNKLFKLKCLRKFRSVCIRGFVTTNQRTELYSLDGKDEDFKLCYKLR